MNHSARRVLSGVSIAVMAAAIAVPVAAQDASPAASGAAGGPYRIGITNPGSVGNGWREEMLCSAQAQGVASGNVSEVKILNEETDPAGQLNHIRTLIADGVDAILVNPSSPDALNPAIKEATDQGIVVIAIDAPVTEPSAYNLSNDQENYGYLGAKWLFDQLGNKGDVVYMRGFAGHPADTARDVGFKRAVEESNGGINVVSETFTDWTQPKAIEQITNLLNAGTHIDGVWTSGIDNVIVDAFKTAGAPFVPTVGADNVGFVGQLLDTTNYPDLKGAAVTNPGSVGGAGVTLALQILGGQLPDSNTVVLTPEVWDNTTPEGIAKLTAANDPSLNPIWPLGLSIPGWTTYTKDQLLACKGPGE
jgi:ribose transport system substrate-binding protein